MGTNKIFMVDKFRGLNESRNGSTGLELGEASKAENFYITDDYKLKSRPGTSVLNRLPGNAKICALWDGLIGEGHWTFMVYHYGSPAVGATLAVIGRNAAAAALEFDGTYSTFMRTDYPIKFFTLGSKLYIVGSYTGDETVPSVISIYDDGDGNILHYNEDPYVPLTLTGCTPAGGGTSLEPLNILSGRIRVQFSADGDAAAYTLPSIVMSVDKVTVDGAEVDGGSYSLTTHIYTFASTPVKGVNNIEFLCSIFDVDHMNAGTKFLKMRHSEAYNGSTDTRLFFYGDGTNICYYTGMPTYGDGLYLPAGNEIAVDSSASAITGLRRHYTRLMAFKPDGAFTIDYEPVTLEDGTVVAGFYVRPASRSIGNDMDGQIQTVGNYPRTMCAGSLYEWRHTAAYYQDERYAKRISEKIAVTLAEADPAKIVTCDDDAAQTYYMFLNDDAGTVLVNRYQLDAWTIYTGEVFKGVAFAVASQGDLLFATGDTVYYFDPDSTFDAPIEEDGELVPISCVWESGYMSFGADYLRKYSSTIWVSMLPEASSQMDITVATDRRDEYKAKSAGRSLLNFGSVDFSNFSFVSSSAPRLQRIKLKVKKFVYYKLIFRVAAPGARATVLGYDQQVRFASYVK